MPSKNRNSRRLTRNQHSKFRTGCSTIGQVTDMLLLTDASAASANQTSRKPVCLCKPTMMSVSNKWMVLSLMLAPTTLVTSKSINTPTSKPGFPTLFHTRIPSTKKRSTNLFMTDTIWVPVNSRPHKILRPSRKMLKSRLPMKLRMPKLTLFPIV